MNRTVEKAKSIIILLFVVSLLFTSFGNCSSNHQMMDCSGSGKNAVINTDGITSPFLPAGETESEKLASLLRQQVLPAKNPFGFSTISFIIFTVISAFLLSVFLTFRRRLLFIHADQFQKPIISYIHDKAGNK